MGSNWLTRLGGLEWFLIFLILAKPFNIGKTKKFDFWDSNNFADFNHQTTSAKLINPDFIIKLVEYSLKKSQGKQWSF